MKSEATSYHDGDPCSPMCYKSMTVPKLAEVESLKARLISPFIEGLIKIGTQIFSYNPCLIMNLFPKDPVHSRLSCAIVFLYFLQEGNLYSQLENKINTSETDLLRHSSQTGTVVVKTGKKKKKKRKRINIDQDKCREISLCFHSYIGEEIFDSNCVNCACNERGFCLPTCQCSPECSLVLQGCACKGKDDCRANKCICYRNKTECIP